MDNPYARPRYPLLIVLSGPSGVGKDTIARHLIDLEPNQFHFVVTATTRPPRANEQHGVDYFFYTMDEFAHLIETNELLEYAIVYDDYKGIPKQQIRDAVASGKDVIMRVDIQGAKTIRRLVPNAITIFLMAESEEAMINRLRERKTETSEGLNLRIAMARQELKRIEEFDYCVINAQSRQEESAAALLAIISAEHNRVKQAPVIL
ncbi:MAG: guanylate kinase [Anaerolineae bacterium]|nr:guanylate kinase [Anaerolineae bacterium]